MYERSIDLFVEKIDHPEKYDLQMSMMEPEVVAKIEEKLTAKTPVYTIAELFVMLAGRNSWNPSDIKYLLRYSEQDIFNWIIKESSVDVVALLSEFICRFGTQNENENQKSVVEKLRNVLEQVQQFPIWPVHLEFIGV